MKRNNRETNDCWWRNSWSNVQEEAICKIKSSPFYGIYVKKSPEKKFLEIKTLVKYFYLSEVLWQNVTGNTVFFSQNCRTLIPKTFYFRDFFPHANLNMYIVHIENRVYREEFTRKKCKTAILLYCFHTAGVLHIFMLYNVLVSGISFYRKSKIIVKRKPNYEIGWLHNWPLIISHRLYAFRFTNDDFPF